MTRKEDNTVTMFETTLKVLDDFKNTWKGRGALVDAAARAESGTKAIRARTREQHSPTEGITDQKAQLRDDLEEKLLVIADAIAAFAAKIGNPDLAAQADLTKSSIDRLADSNLVQTAGRIADLATEKLADLGPYGVTDANKKELEDAAALFDEAKDSPREAIIGRKVETLSLPADINSVRSIFRTEIDKLITGFKKSSPDFYNAYFAARIIVDRPATIPAKEETAPPPKPAATPPPGP
jgi:hypothetical protein